MSENPEAVPIVHIQIADAVPVILGPLILLMLELRVIPFPVLDCCSISDSKRHVLFHHNS